jgi:pyruvate-formate lyase-activating enzyme
VDGADEAPHSRRRRHWDATPRAYLRGLGEMQTQHTCILLEDITAACNLTLPNVLRRLVAEPRGHRAGGRVARATSTQRLARENGRIDVLMLSGGEPTLHPDFEEIVETCARARRRAQCSSTATAFASRSDAFLASSRSTIAASKSICSSTASGSRRTARIARADLRRIKADAIGD